MKHFFIAFLFFLCPILKAQTVFVNTIYGEILGNSSALSLNYDRIIFNREVLKLTLSTGFGIVPTRLLHRAFGNPVPNNLPGSIGVPIACNLLLGKESHHLEVGLGFSYIQGERYVAYNNVGTGYSKTVYQVGRLGYRYQRTIGGMFFSGGLNQFFSLIHFGRITSSSFHFLFGLACGYTF